MTLPVRFHHDAAEELISGAAYYEAHRSNLGVEFIDRVNAALRRVAAQPTRFMMIHTTPRGVNIHRAKIEPRRFRYVVIFAVLPTELAVMAVAHTSKQPGYWMSRLLDLP